MAGSTESMARMGAMVKNVSPQECPQGYEGTYPDCKKIPDASTKPMEEAIVVYDKETTKGIEDKKERRKQRRINRKYKNN